MEDGGREGEAAAEPIVKFAGSPGGSPSRAGLPPKSNREDTGGTVKESGILVAAWAAPRPQDAPKTKPSSKLFDARRLAPCKPLLVTSPAAQRFGIVVRPSESPVTPPIMS